MGEIFLNEEKYGVDELGNLANVNILTPTDGQVLTYDETNDVWKNENGGGGGFTIKSFTYTGSNTNPWTLTFPEKPQIVLGIQSVSADSRNYSCKVNSFVWGALETWCCWRMTNHTNRGGTSVDLTYDANNDKSVTLQSNDAGAACNYNNGSYIVYYI